MATQEQVVPTTKARVRTKSRGQQRERWGKIGRYIAVVIVVFIALAPLYWTFVTSIKGGIEIQSSPPTLYPHTASISNYQALTLSPYFLPDLKNSVIIATITTILALLFGSLCAYEFARTNLRSMFVILVVVLYVNLLLI